MGDCVSVSGAQQRAVNTYLKKTYDDIKVRAPKGKRKVYQDAAKVAGYDSFNQFVLDAIDEKMSRL